MSEEVCTNGLCGREASEILCSACMVMYKDGYGEGYRSGMIVFKEFCDEFLVGAVKSLDDRFSK